VSALVAGRECGACTACCDFIPIKTEKLEKPANTLCIHCVPGKGCSVYDLRPDICRSWHCGWRISNEIPDDWRPDRSGVVFWFAQRINDPDQTIVVLDRTKVLLSPAFEGYLAGQLHKGTRLALQVPGPAGHFPVSFPLNAMLNFAQSLGPGGMAAQLLYVISNVYHRRPWKTDGLAMRSSIA
jgi:hypothetical protein